MALPAGRKGVLPSELTPDGKIKIPSPLPEYSVSDAGKFLGVDSNGDLEFATPQPENELPEYSVSDAGKFLGVDSNGDLEFATPESGGKVYLHMIHAGSASYANYTDLITIYSSDSAPIDNGEKLLAYMKAKNFNSKQRMVPCIGKYNSTSQTRNVGVYARMSSDTDRRVVYVTDAFTSGEASDLGSTDVYTDNVIEL